jgi:hypothetical protein
MPDKVLFQVRKESRAALSSQTLTLREGVHPLKGEREKFSITCGT